MRHVTAILLVLAFCGFPSFADDTLSPEAVVVRMAEAVNERNFDLLDDLVAQNVRRHSASTPGVVVESLDQFKAFLHEDLAAVPDAQQELDFIFSCGDMVAARVFYRGTQSGAMGPFPASGNTVEIPFIAILRVEEGKIVEIWVEWDNLNALTQLGHVPPAAAK